MVKKALHILLIIIWLIVIFIFSNQPKEQSDKSASIFDPAINIVAKDNKQRSFAVTIVRKCAHITEYIVLSFLLLIAIKDYKEITYKDLIIILIICILIAILDEIHQAFIPGRAGRWYDVLIDTFGSLLFLIPYKFIKRIEH